MKNVMLRTTLGVLTGVLGLAASAKPAHAWAQYRNAGSGGTSYYLGVAGGYACKTGGSCGLPPGAQVILWTLNQSMHPLDQRWNATEQVHGQSPVTATVPNAYPDYNNGTTQLCLAVQNNSQSLNAQVQVDDCKTQAQAPGQYWQVKRAEDLSPIPDASLNLTGCFAFINQNTQMALSAYQGSVTNGSRVVQYSFCSPNSNACGNPSFQYHKDQFWCPEQH